MDIHCSPQPYVHREKHSCYELDCDGDDDDTFYAELKRQVLLLTAEDEEELHEIKHQNSAKVLKEGAFVDSSPVVQPGCYFNWSGYEETDSVPSWLSDLWNAGNGTGVFIPCIVKPRRRYKQRRKKNERGREYKPVMNK